MDDILLSKIETLERCLNRMREEYVGFETEFETNFTKQDSIVLNLQRACETVIDMANRIIATRKLGLPKNAKESFLLLNEADMISEDLKKKMQNMVGFRNIAVHDYENLDIQIVKAILEKHLSDFEAFSKVILSRL
jgi:uncharacterized protein YutE (UPF0331/DUF86 family)